MAKNFFRLKEVFGPKFKTTKTLPKLVTLEHYETSGFTIANSNPSRKREMPSFLDPFYVLNLQDCYDNVLMWKHVNGR